MAQGDSWTASLHVDQLNLLFEVGSQFSCLSSDGIVIANSSYIGATPPPGWHPPIQCPEYPEISDLCDVACSSAKTAGDIEIHALLRIVLGRVDTIHIPSNDNPGASVIDRIRRTGSSAHVSELQVQEVTDAPGLITDSESSASELDHGQQSQRHRLSAISLQELAVSDANPVHSYSRCERCDKPVDSEVQLRRHERCHKKNFWCQDCGKGFTWRKHLERHATTHTQEKIFACGSCYQQFTRKDNLLRHFRNIHLQSVSQQLKNDLITAPKDVRYHVTESRLEFSSQHPHGLIIACGPSQTANRSYTGAQTSPNQTQKNQTTGQNPNKSKRRRSTREVSGGPTASVASCKAKKPKTQKPRLACPWRRHDPGKYNKKSLPFRTCETRGFQYPAQLHTHMRRVHDVPCGITVEGCAGLDGTPEQKWRTEYKKHCTNGREPDHYPPAYWGLPLDDPDGDDFDDNECGNATVAGPSHQALGLTLEGFQLLAREENGYNAALAGRLDLLEHNFNLQQQDHNQLFRLLHTILAIVGNLAPAQPLTQGPMAMAPPFQTLMDHFTDANPERPLFHDSTPIAPPAQTLPSRLTDAALIQPFSHASIPMVPLVMDRSTQTDEELPNSPKSPSWPPPNGGGATTESDAVSLAMVSQAPQVVDWFTETKEEMPTSSQAASTEVTITSGTIPALSDGATSTETVTNVVGGGAAGEKEGKLQDIDEMFGNLIAGWVYSPKTCPAETPNVDESHLPLFDSI